MLEWSKKNLFNTKFNSLLTIVIGFFVIKFFVFIFDWLIISSVWSGTAEQCKEAGGACIAFIKAKFVYILFGIYPRELLWRPILMMMILLSTIFYTRKKERWNLNLVKVWGLVAFIVIWLMGGGLLLEPVGMEKWGGLPLTLLLATFGILLSYPFGILLALGRRSNNTAIKSICVVYIELIRGVPLISLLFMSSVMLPLLLPEGIVISKLLRAQLAIVFFSAAYMAEVVRGGLQIIPKGQTEACQSLGLNRYQTLRLVVLPQALTHVIPPTVNTAIGMFKDTSLVIIIALFDLMSTSKSALTDPDWLGFSMESYLFVSIIYFVFCYTLSRYSKNLEKELSRGHSR